MTKMSRHLPMHRVVFVVYPGFELLDLSGPGSAFNSADCALRLSGKADFYRVEVTSGPAGR
jgi:hypothetical protein